MVAEIKKKEIKLFRDFIAYESEEQYLNDKSCLNAHTIMNYAIKDTLGFKEKSSDKPYFTVGKLTEDILFHPETVNDKYFIIPNYASKHLSILADNVLSVILRSLDPLEELDALENTEDGNEVIMGLVRSNDIFNTIKKPETLLKKLKDENFFNTIKTKLENLNKLAVTEEDYRLSSILADKIINGKATKQIFEQRNKSHIEFIDQFRIKITDFFRAGLHAKIAVDLLVVDHNTRQVFFYDIKTDRHSTHEFINESYYKYRLDLQLDFYDKVLLQFMKYNFPTYNLNTGKLIVVSKEYISQEPAIFVKSNRNKLQPENNINKDKRLTLRDYVSNMSFLIEVAGGIEKLSNLDQVTDYYFNGNYICLPD